MFDLKQKAFELRKSGLSYRAIQKETGVSISTLSAWLHGQPWSKEVADVLRARNAQMAATRLRAFKRARGFALQFSYVRAQEVAEKEFTTHVRNPLFLVGLTLYFAVGDTTSRYYCRLRTSDPRKISLFRQFLTVFAGVSDKDIRYSLLLPYGSVEAEVRGQWHTIAKIPLRGFTKSTFLRKPRNKMPNSQPICIATYASRSLKEKMVVWLRLLADEFAPLE